MDLLLEKKGTTDLVFKLEKLIECAVEEGLSNLKPTECVLGVSIGEYTINVGENTIKLLSNNTTLNPIYKLLVNGVEVNGAVSKDFLVKVSEKIIDTHRSLAKEENTRQICLSVLNSWK